MRKYSPISRAIVAACVGLAGTAVPGVVCAQEEQALQLEEVIVTARKQAEDLQEVPVAVTSLNAAVLTSMNVTETMQLAEFTPGLFTEANSANNLSSVKTTIRGQVQWDTLSTLDPSVGWYADDVYLARSTGINGSLFDLERVEVLKGPQGTLYGRNTTGGAVRMISRKADPGAGWDGYVTQTVSSFGGWKLGGAMNLPLIDGKLAVRLTALTDQVDDGWAKETVVRMPIAGLYPGNKWIDIQTHEEDVGKHDIDLYRIGVTYNATDALTFEAMWMRNAYYGNAPLIVPWDVPQIGYTAPKDPYKDGRVNQVQQAWANSETVSFTTNYEISDTLSTKLIYAYRDLHSSFMSDVDGTAVPLNYFIKPFVQNSRQNSVEWQLTGQSFDDRLDWIAGIYWFTEKAIDNSTSNSAQQLPVVLAGTYNGTIDENESQSAFMSGTWRFNDAFSMTLGTRYTKDSKPVIAQSTETLLPQLGLGDFRCRYDLTNPPPNSDPTDCTWSDSADYDYWSYTASVNWNVNDDVMAYVRSGRSYRAGGQNLRGLGTITVGSGATSQTINTNEPFDPESATDVELGLKSYWFDRRLLLNVAAYHIWYDNVQVSQLLQTPKGLTTFIDNLSKGEYDGLEVEAQWLATENLKFTGTASLFSFDFENPADYAQGMPDQEYSIAATYTWPLSVGDLAFDLNYSHRGEFYPGSSATKQAIEALDLIVQSSEQVGARISLALDEGLSVGLWGRNLTDERFTLSPLVLPTPFRFASAGLSEPRSFGVDITFDF
jgi:iron complex outermembrane recepter protein